MLGLAFNPVTGNLLICDHRTPAARPRGALHTTGFVCQVLTERVAALRQRADEPSLVPWQMLLTLVPGDACTFGVRRQGWRLFSVEREGSR